MDYSIDYSIYEDSTINILNILFRIFNNKYNFTNRWNLIIIFNHLVYPNFALNYSLIWIIHIKTHYFVRNIQYIRALGNKRG